MSKQTAIQWLAFELSKLGLLPHGVPNELYEQGKQMEKEQHADTWLDSRIESNDEDYIGKEKSFEQYYEQTYGGKK